MAQKEVLFHIIKPTLPLYVKWLKEIQKLLSKPDRWTKEALARDSMGRTVSPTAPSATCWCLSGAVDKVLSKTPAPGIHHKRFVEELYELLYQEQIDSKDGPSRNVPYINDRMGYPVIHRLVQAAPQWLEKKCAALPAQEK